MAPFQHLLPSPEHAMAVGAGAMLLAQQRTGLQWQQPHPQQRPAYAQLQQRQRCAPVGLQATLQPLGTSLSQQHLPAFPGGFLAYAGHVPSYLQVRVAHSRPDQHGARFYHCQSLIPRLQTAQST